MQRTASLLLLSVGLASCELQPPRGPVCGNGVVEAGELCDGADVRDVTCQSIGLGPGTVRCAAACERLDTTGCGAIDSGVVDGGVPGDGGFSRDAGGDGGVRDAGLPDAGALGVDAGPSRALHVVGGELADVVGAAVDVRGAISCCGGGYGWPLFDEAWVDLVASHRANFLHVRLGPFLTQNPNGETDWAATGGGYVEANGLGDLTRFNETYWARVRALLEYARVKGLWVEVDVLDGWGVKHCKWGDIPGYSPWDPAFNVQHQDVCTGTGGAAIAAGSVQEAWVKKVVLETGRYDHVVYQDGNEIGIVGGYDPAWSLSMAALIHAEEARLGYARHLVGTNSGDSTTLASPLIDYGELHQNTAPTRAECGGKPCLVNEYNPRPPLTPAQFHERLCDARRNGTAFWYWRHEQDVGALQTSLSLLDAPCP